MPKNQSNDKNRVMIAYLVPKQLPVVLARIYRYQAPPCLAVFLNRETKEFNMLEVPV